MEPPATMAIDRDYHVEEDEQEKAVNEWYHYYYFLNLYWVCLLFFRSESKEKIQFSFEYVIDCLCLCLCLCLTGDAAVPAVMIAQRAALITFAVSTSAKCYRLHLKYCFFPSFLH
jgi:hypothetical protein